MKTNQNLPTLAVLCISAMFLMNPYKAKATTTDWTGLVNTDWSNVLNWDNGVPTSTTDVVIDNGTTGYTQDPTLDNTGLVCATLSIDNAATLNGASGTSLTVNGDLNGTATFNAYASTITITGNMTISTFDAGTSTIIFAGSSQSVDAYTFYNMTIANGATLSSSSLVIDNALEVDAGAELIPAASSVITGLGAFTGSGTIDVTNITASVDNFSSQYAITSSDLSDLTVKFAGTNSQQVGSNTFGNLEIANSSGVSAIGNIAIDSKLTLNYGLLALGAYNLTLASGSSTSGASSSSYIQINGSGKCIADDVSSTTTIPIGDEYAPITIANGGGADYTLGLVNAVTNNGGSPALSSDAVGITWSILASSNKSDVNITLQWPASSELSSFDRSLSFIAMRSSTTGDWTEVNSPSSAGGSGPYTQSATISALSIGTTYYFGVGDPSSPLPVSLISFAAVYQNNQVSLNWSTASEQNNAYFEVQRGTDALHWTPIGKVTGNGTSNHINSYNKIDNLAGIVPSGILYYRLKQVDFNGSPTYSNIRSVNISSPALAVSSYPNPTNSILNIKWTSKTNDNVTLRLVNTNGVSVMKQNVSGEGLMQKQFNLSNLPDGMYYLQILGNKNDITQAIYKD